MIATAVLSGTGSIRYSKHAQQTEKSLMPEHRPFWTNGAGVAAESSAGDPRACLLISSSRDSEDDAKGSLFHESTEGAAPGTPVVSAFSPKDVFIL